MGFPIGILMSGFYWTVSSLELVALVTLARPQRIAAEMVSG